MTFDGVAGADAKRHRFLVLGAGPPGQQLGRMLQEGRHDYAIVDTGPGRPGELGTHVARGSDGAFELLCSDGGVRRGDVLVLATSHLDVEIFDSAVRPTARADGRPEQIAAWESKDVPGLYFCGPLMDGVEQDTAGRLAAIRALYHVLVTRRGRDEAWPGYPVTAEPGALAGAVAERILARGALAALPETLCDVVVVWPGHKAARYFEELPRAYVPSPEFEQHDEHYVLSFEARQPAAPQAVTLRHMAGGAIVSELSIDLEPADVVIGAVRKYFEEEMAG